MLGMELHCAHLHCADQRFDRIDACSFSAPAYFWNPAGSHVPLMSSISFSAISNALAVSLAALAPSAGRSGSDQSRTSLDQRMTCSTRTGPSGISAARCCLMGSTTLATPIFYKRAIALRSSASPHFYRVVRAQESTACRL